MALHGATQRSETVKKKEKIEALQERVAELEDIVIGYKRRGFGEREAVQLKFYQSFYRTVVNAQSIEAVQSAVSELQQSLKEASA